MKKEQWQIAEVLYELGMSYDVIEKITSIPQWNVKENMQHHNNDEKYNNALHADEVPNAARRQ